MPWEHIGECGDADAAYERDRMVAEVRLGVAYVKLICGEPPPGCKIGPMWHEAEEGSYATVGLHSDGELDRAAWAYIGLAERALSRFDQAVDWEPLDEEEDEDQDEEGEDEEDDETDCDSSERAVQTRLFEPEDPLPE